MVDKKTFKYVVKDVFFRFMYIKTHIIHDILLYVN